jgi:hypothetical protein
MAIILKNPAKVTSEVGKFISMNNNDLAFTPALELAQLIRLREVSPLELVEVYLECDSLLAESR